MDIGVYGEFLLIDRFANCDVINVNITVSNSA